MWILDENVQKIIDAILEKEKFTEREIKKKIKIKENEIRKVLYRLHELGIVYPIRTIIIREGKYDYEWGLRIKDPEEVYSIIVNREIKKLEEEKKNEPEIVYVCEECKLSFDFDASEEYNFRCPECGSLLIPKKNMRIEEIDEIITKLRELLNRVKEIKIKAKN